MRLDVYLCDIGLAASRTEAKGFILAGAVSVDGKIIKKPAYSFDVPPKEITVDKSAKKYVSRGGLKLEAAIDAFGINCTDRLAVDIGASSGGFTDCLLKHGAARVIAIDSGTAQLVGSLLADERVISIENCNARYLTPDDIPYIPTLAVMDVSFISATYIMPSIFTCLANGGEFICLVKPQFEVGKANIGKGGIVKSSRLREDALAKVVAFGESIGFRFCGSIISPIEGGDGNVEFLAHFKK